MRDHHFSHILNKSASPSISLHRLIVKAVSMALKFMVAHDAVIHQWCKLVSTPETVLCKSLIHSYQIGKLGPNP